MHILTILFVVYLFILKEELIVSNLESKSADNFKLLALIFVSIVRSIGLDARIVISADPRPLTGIEEDKSTTTTIEGQTDSRKETYKNSKSKIDAASKETIGSETVKIQHFLQANV